MIMITVLMLQHWYAQPCMNGLTKSGEVAVDMIGSNTNSTVYSIVSFDILNK